MTVTDALQKTPFTSASLTVSGVPAAFAHNTLSAPIRTRALVDYATTWWR